MVSRRFIREVVMQILYAYELRKEDIFKVAEGILPEEINSQPKSRDFALSLLEKIVSNLALIDSKIKNHAENWELDRMAIIDKNLMRIAIAEMLYFPDVPPKVSINEAIEIAKQYSTDKSGRFVNGILDAVRLELIQNGELNKSGRGLVDMPAKYRKDTHQLPVVVVNEPSVTSKDEKAMQASQSARSQPSRRSSAQGNSRPSATPSQKPNSNRNTPRGGSDKPKSR